MLDISVPLFLHRVIERAFASSIVSRLVEKPHRDATLCHVGGMTDCYSASAQAYISLGKNGRQNQRSSSPLHLPPFVERNARIV
jgi:hypothetical protein